MDDGDNMSIIKHKHINRVNKTKIVKKKSKMKTINKTVKLGNRDISEVISKRYIFISVLLVLFFLLLFILLFTISILKLYVSLIVS